MSPIACPHCEKPLDEYGSSTNQIKCPHCGAAKPPLTLAPIAPEGPSGFDELQRCDENPDSPGDALHVGVVSETEGLSRPSPETLTTGARKLAVPTDPMRSNSDNVMVESATDVSDGRAAVEGPAEDAGTDDAGVTESSGGERKLAVPSTPMILTDEVVSAPGESVAEFVSVAGSHDSDNESSGLALGDAPTAQVSKIDFEKSDLVDAESDVAFDPYEAASGTDSEWAMSPANTVESEVNEYEWVETDGRGKKKLAAAIVAGLLAAGGAGYVAYSLMGPDAFGGKSMVVQQPVNTSGMFPSHDFVSEEIAALDTSTSEDRDMSAARILESETILFDVAESESSETTPGQSEPDASVASGDGLASSQASIPEGDKPNAESDSQALSTEMPPPPNAGPMQPASDREPIVASTNLKASAAIAAAISYDPEEPASIGVDVAAFSESLQAAKIALTNVDTANPKANLSALRDFYTALAAVAESSATGLSASQRVQVDQLLSAVIAEKSMWSILGRIAPSWEKMSNRPNKGFIVFGSLGGEALPHTVRNHSVVKVGWFNKDKELRVYGNDREVLPVLGKKALIIGAIQDDALADSVVVKLGVVRPID